jgi:hypothetical protein
VLWWGRKAPRFNQTRFWIGCASDPDLAASAQVQVLWQFLFLARFRCWKKSCGISGTFSVLELD